MFTDCDTEDSRELRRLESYGVNFSMDDVVKVRALLVGGGGGCATNSASGGCNKLC